MSNSASFLFAASVLVCTSELCFSQDDLSRKLLESIRSAEKAQRGLATVFRVRSFTVGHANNPALTGGDTVIYSIRTLSQNAGENVFVTHSRSDDPDLGKVVQFMAKVEDRIFGGSGTNFTAVVPRDITDMAKDEKWAKVIEIDWKSLNCNPMALPFLTFDSIYMRKSDFNSVHSKFATCSISYADESGLVSVWENLKEGVVIEFKLAKEFNNLPVQCCFYHRPKNAKRLLNTDQLGELVYRTRTEWSKLESSNLPRVHAMPKWVPKRIDLEHFPTSFNPTAGYSNIEILAVWQQVPSDILSEVEKSKEFAIGQEFIPPSSQIERLYVELEDKLERTIAEAELKRQKRP